MRKVHVISSEICQIDLKFQTRVAIYLTFSLRFAQLPARHNLSFVVAVAVTDTDAACHCVFTTSVSAPTGFVSRSRSLSFTLSVSKSIGFQCIIDSLFAFPSVRVFVGLFSDPSLCSYTLNLCLSYPIAKLTSLKFALSHHLNTTAQEFF